MKKLGAALGAIALISTSVIGSAVPAQATDYGINMLEVCKYEVSSIASVILVAPRNVMSWRCKVGGLSYSIDLELWCEYQNGLGAYPIYTNFNDPYSWKCRT